MAKTIDPAFQAAPFLGESSHDPIEFARRQRTLKYKADEQKRDEMNRSIQQGLDKLMLDVKGWEDQEGFKEIMARQDKSLKLFTDLSKKGLNLTSPKTSQEIEAFRAINKYHSETKQMVDEWDRNKKAYDIITEAIRQDSTKPESERKIDPVATRANVEKTMSGKSIKDRKMTVENLLVFKPEVGDVHDYVSKNLEFIPKPDVITEPVTDEAGNTVNKQREVETPEYLKKKEDALRNLFRTSPDRVKNGVIDAKKKDTELNKDTRDIMSDEDYFVSMYSPAFKQKFIDKRVGTGNGGGLEFSFLGVKTKIEPGAFRPEPLIYGDKTLTGTYTFKPTTKPFVVPVGKESSQFMYNKWMPLKDGGTVEATLYAYDPKSDSFIFNTTATSKTPWVENNTSILVPRSVIGKDADNLPVTVNGEKKALKDVFNLAPTPEVKLIGGKDWRKNELYIPGKTGRK